MRRNAMLGFGLVVSVVVGCASRNDETLGAQNAAGGAGGISVTGIDGGPGGSGVPGKDMGGTDVAVDGSAGEDMLPTPLEPIPILTNGNGGRFALVNPENGDLKPLCKGGANNARWSPDKSAIVGDTEVDIVITTSACENRTILTKNADQFGNSKGISYMPRYVGDRVVFIQKATSKVNVPNPAYIPGLPATTPQGQMTIEKTVVDSLELMSMEPKLSSASPTKLTDFRRGGVGVEAFDIVGATVCYTKVQLEPRVDKGTYCADWPTLSNERKMSDKPGFSVSMSPDGKKVLFRTETNGKAIEVADTKTGGSTFLAGCTTGVEGVPVWAPDGRRIAYSCNSLQDLGLYVIGADGSNARKLSAEVQTTFDWR